MIKLKVHSFVDIITNSSTVIYTKQEKSEKAFHEMVNEFFKSFDVKVKSEDLFKTGIFCDTDYYVDSDDCPDEITYKTIDEFIIKILSGEIEKPEWMKEVEKNYENDYEYPSSFYLHVLATDPRYEGLIKKCLSFLNSPESDSYRDG